MKMLPAWLLCLLLLGLTLQGSTSRAHPQAMEDHTPDINPAWYAGRGIRPVGRFGRRRAAQDGGYPRPGPQRRPACFPLVGDTRSLLDREQPIWSRK